MFEMIDIVEKVPAKKVATAPVKQISLSGISVDPEFLKISAEIDEKFYGAPVMPASKKAVNEERVVFDYTDKVNFDHLIGALTRRDDMVILGQICKIDYTVDEYGHNIAFAEVAHFDDDDVTLINCRNLMILR